MAANFPAKPAATGTTNTQQSSCVKAPCTLSKTLLYRIKATTATNLNLPYAVELNGSVLPEFKDRPRAIKCDGKSAISLTVKTGDKVALYLNSDASPDFRKEKVYAVTVGDNDIVVTVTEKKGKSSDADTPVLKETKSTKDAKGNEKKTDHYAAPLTGDIWKKISHKYTPSETDARTVGSAQEIRDAVRKFYDGSLTAQNLSMSLTIPAKDGSPTQTIAIKMAPGADTNSKANIQNFDQFSDGLTRVHPNGYVALLEAARDAGATEIKLSSTWRPLVGSIAHRSGLGLDVTWVDSSRFNREGLRTQAKNPNVSDEEKRLFKEKQAAEQKVAQSKKKLDALKAEQAQLNKLKRTDPGKVDPRRDAALPSEITQAEAEVIATQQASKRAESDWNQERDQNEPTTIKSFRTSLMKCRCVRQVFDPWKMDANTQDTKPETPNTQTTGNEKLHANHLHITVRDPKVLRES